MDILKQAIKESSLAQELQKLNIPVGAEIMLRSDIDISRVTRQWFHTIYN